MEYNDVVQILKGRDINYCIPSRYNIEENRPNVFVRHDGNVKPYILIDMIEQEYYNDIVSSNYICWGISQRYPLDLNINLFKRAERNDFEIGFLSWGSDEKLQAVCMNDLSKLSQFFYIRTYVYSNVESKSLIDDILSNMPLRDFFSSISSSGTLDGFVKDGDTGFVFSCNDEEQDSAVRDESLGLEKFNAFVQNMVCGKSYVIRLKSEYWENLENELIA